MSGGAAGRGIAPLYERAKSWRGREGKTILAILMSIIIQI